MNFYLKITKLYLRETELCLMKQSNKSFSHGKVDSAQKITTSCVKSGQFCAAINILHI